MNHASRVNGGGRKWYDVNAKNLRVHDEMALGCQHCDPQERAIRL